MEVWAQVLMWVFLTPVVIVGFVCLICLLICAGGGRRGGRGSCRGIGRSSGRGSWIRCCCCCESGRERVFVAPPTAQYPYPGYSPSYPYPMQMQYAPMYFYPQGYAPPPPPQVAVNQKLIDIFRKLDKDNSGGVDINEATLGAKEFGALGYFLASEEEVKAFFTAADKNRDGKIDYNEFVNITTAISAKHPHPNPPQVPPPPKYAPAIDEKLFAIFKKLDKDNSGGIDVNEAMAGAKEFGALGYFLASEEEVKAFFATADRNNDSKIDFGEFSNIAGAIAAKHPHPHPPEVNQTGFPAPVVSVMGQPREIADTVYSSNSDTEPGRKISINLSDG